MPHHLTRTPHFEEFGFTEKRSWVEDDAGTHILDYVNGAWTATDTGIAYVNRDAAFAAWALANAHDHTYIPTWEELGAEHFGQYWIAWHNEDGTSADYYLARPRIHFYDADEKIVTHLDCEDEPDARWNVAVLHALAAGFPL